ncbi:MAG: hypothetical protein Q9195_007044 [Heterodermia aff. obscurata]
MYACVAFISLCLFSLQASAVSVTLRYADDHPNPHLMITMVQHCNNLRPGRCCQPRPLPMIPGLGNPNGPFRNFRVAEFTGLEPLDIASVWQPQGTTGGCSGVPRETNHGPGNWRYPADGNADVILTGGSYIKLPTQLPKDPSSRAPMLEAQGILGLITGGGQYVTAKAGNSLLQQAARAALALHGGGSGGQRRRRRRGIRTKDKGVVFAQPPPGNVWPDLVVVNGTSYTEESAGSSIYRSEDGKVLDFSGS